MYRTYMCTINITDTYNQCSTFFVQFAPSCFLHTKSPVNQEESIWHKTMGLGPLSMISYYTGVRSTCTYNKHYYYTSRATTTTVVYTQ